MEDKYGNIVGNMEFQRQKIIELVEKIENLAILEYLYIFIQGKVGRYIADEESK